MAKSKRSAAAQAERLGFYAKPAPFDAEAEQLQAEFAGLDLTEEERADLADALRLRLGTNAEQIAARAILARLRADLAKAVEQTLRFEAERGGSKPSKMPRSEALRLLSRDGLAELHSRGKINGRALDGGLAYRRRYELAFKGLRSTLGTEGSAITPTPDEMVRSRTRLARWEVDRVKVEQLVIQRCGEIALRYLRKVAGEGASMSSQLDAKTRSAATFDKACGILARALAICAERLPLSDG